MPARSIEPVLHSFAYGLDFLRDQVAGVADGDRVAQPGGLANHPAWVVGHLTFTCQMLGGVLGLSPWLPEDWAERYGSGSVPAGDPNRYEAKVAVLARLGDAEARIVRAVGRMDDAALDGPFPDESLREVFPTIRHALTQVLVAHTAYHVAQVATWRKAMGMPPLGRSFE